MIFVVPIVTRPGRLGWGLFVFQLLSHAHHFPPLVDCRCLCCQSHPARDAHDTFFIKDPASALVSCFVSMTPSHFSVSLPPSLSPESWGIRTSTMHFAGDAVEESGGVIVRPFGGALSKEAHVSTLYYLQYGGGENTRLSRLLAHATINQSLDARKYGHLRHAFTVANTTPVSRSSFCLSSSHTYPLHSPFLLSSRRVGNSLVCLPVALLFFSCASV